MARATVSPSKTRAVATPALAAPPAAPNARTHSTAPARSSAWATSVSTTCRWARCAVPMTRHALQALASMASAAAPPPAATACNATRRDPRATVSPAQQALRQRESAWGILPVVQAFVTRTDGAHSQQVGLSAIANAQAPVRIPWRSTSATPRGLAKRLPPPRRVVDSRDAPEQASVQPVPRNA